MIPVPEEVRGQRYLEDAGHRGWTLGAQSKAQKGREQMELRRQEATSTPLVQARFAVGTWGKGLSVRTSVLLKSWEELVEQKSTDCWIQDIICDKHDQMLVISGPYLVLLYFSGIWEFALLIPLQFNRAMWLALANKMWEEVIYHFQDKTLTSPWGVL